MSDKQHLIPTYLETDFRSSKERLIELMKHSDTFKDYNYEGSNITMLIELMSYLIDTSTYFSNKIVKNIYPESAEIYETMYSISRIRGYRPKGYIAPQINLKIELLYDESVSFLPSPNETITIPAWFILDSGWKTADGDSVYYTTTNEYTFTIPDDDVSGTYEFEIPMKQGTPEYYVYTGENIVNNKILLPNIRFDHDLTPYDENPSIHLYINNEMWTRVEDFYNTYITENEILNVYILEYDKYERYNIVFSPTHNMPNINDRIQIIIGRTFGPEGSISSGVDAFEPADFSTEVPTLDIDNRGIEIVSKPFITCNRGEGFGVEDDYYNVFLENHSHSAGHPETIEDIRESSGIHMYTQLRNISKKDYVYHLNTHPYVYRGLAWGENEVNPGNTIEYNKIYFSVIPTYWETSTITMSSSASPEWKRDEVSEGTDIIVPDHINSEFLTSLYEFLEPRKQLNVYEVFVLPEIVYFAFDIGVKTKRGYNFGPVKEELRRKLSYYFEHGNREFNETIDFKEIHRYLLDNSIRDEENSPFRYLNRINNIVFRDILTYTESLSGDKEEIFEPNENGNYPMYTVINTDYYGNNNLRPVKIGKKQYPMLSIDNCIILQED